MRRILVFAVAALALLGVVTPDAFAQAPTPKFQISGLVDQLTTYSSNVSNIDGDLSLRDKQWYGRTRGRFDFIGEVGKAKAVLGIEVDLAYGQTGSNDTNIPTTTNQQFGTTGSFDLNTDVRTVIEVKWLYTEFEVPLIPVPTVVRLGGQPFGGASNYKLAVYANGDFAGLNIVSTITPNVKIVATYAQVEEELTGCESPCTSANRGITYPQLRGDDFAIIIAPEITPMKGLDIKPLYSYFYASGTTSGSSRQGRGGVNTTTAYTAANGDWRPGINEGRHTFGLDARLRMGAFSLDPTVMYQFGQRDVVVPAALAVSGGKCEDGCGKTAGSVASADISAWLLDIRAGYQLGPLLLQAMYMFTTGNGDKDTTLGDVKYFQPLSTDTSYLGDWGTQLTSLGLDYLNALGESGRYVAYPGVSIGWDKYGRQQIGLRATYAMTPALSFTAGVNGHFTQRSVYKDTAALLNGAGLTPNFASNASGSKSTYVGTEFNIGATWRFAPGLVWDNAFGYMLPGEVMDAMVAGTGTNRDAKDPYIFTSRVRFTF